MQRAASRRRAIVCPPPRIDNACFGVRRTMTARILDGRKIAGEGLERVTAGVKVGVDAGMAAPGLAVVVVGAQAASAVYVKNKRKACLQVGFKTFDFDLPAQTSEAELFGLVDRLNADPNVHGILVQLPLPPHINANALIDH